MIDLSGLLEPSRAVDLAAGTREEAIRELCRVLGRSPEVGDAAALEAAVLEREAAISTGIGLGIAVPHAKIPSVREFVLALGRSRGGIDFQALDGGPVRIVVLIAGPEGRQARYLQVLAGVTLRLKEESVRAALLGAPGPREMAAALVGEPGRKRPRPPAVRP